MMIKHILLPLTGEASSESVALCGLTLAKQLGAHATAGYEDELGPLYPAPLDMASPVANYGMFYEAMQKLRQERKASARRWFDHAVAATRLPIVSSPVCRQGSTMWVSDANDRDSMLSTFATLADLAVLESPGTRSAIAPWNVIDDVLFKARRAALVVPSQTKSVDLSNLLIAWNGSAEAARSVERSLDLIEPGARVTVLQIGDLKPDRTPVERLIEYLGWHCVTAHLRRVPGQPNATCQTILDEARAAGAGCIVMGAYTHSRTRELLLGGVTDFMLRHAHLPLLMAH